MQQRVLQLEEHCRVLEQLLESRNAEVEVLRAESARQARELEQLREAARALPPRPLPSASSLSWRRR